MSFPSCICRRFSSSSVNGRDNFIASLKEETVRRSSSGAVPRPSMRRVVIPARKIFGTCGRSDSFLLFSICIRQNWSVAMGKSTPLRSCKKYVPFRHGIVHCPLSKLPRKLPSTQYSDTINGRRPLTIMLSGMAESCARRAACFSFSSGEIVASLKP